MPDEIVVETVIAWKHAKAPTALGTERVKRDKGTAGVDGVTLEAVENLGVEKLLSGFKKRSTQERTEHFPC